MSQESERSQSGNAQSSSPQQYVFVIDRSPVNLGRDTSGNIVVTGDSTGGAGKVVISDASAALKNGKDVVFVAVAKTAEERELAQALRANPDSEPFRYNYDGNDVSLAFVDVDQDTYALARDGLFSSHLWFTMQEQDHPEIRTPYDPRMWSAYKETNRVIAETVYAVTGEDSRLFVHDGHVALVGPELDRMGWKGEKMFVGHTAWPGEEFMTRDRAREEQAYLLPSHVMREIVTAIASYDSVNFSGKGWSKNFEASARAVLGENVPLPRISSVPVPVDAAYVRNRFNSARTQQILNEGIDGRPSVRNLVGDRFVVATGGRAEWYKQIDKVIQSEEHRLIDAPNQPQTVTAIISSATRPVVPGYRDHFDNDVVAEIDRVNKILAPEIFATFEPRLKEINAELAELLPSDPELKSAEGKALWAEASVLREDTDLPIRLVDGSDYNRVLAWMGVHTHWITGAHVEGYNLMALEAAVAADEALQATPESQRIYPTQLLSESTGLHQHLVKKYGDDKPENARAEATATMRIMLSYVRPDCPNEQEKSDAQIREVGSLTGTFLAVVHGRRRAQIAADPDRLLKNTGYMMHKNLIRITDRFTPARHMHKLDEAFDKALEREAVQVVEKALNTGFMSGKGLRILEHHPLPEPEMHQQQLQQMMQLARLMDDTLPLGPESTEISVYDEALPEELDALQPDWRRPEPVERRVPSLGEFGL